MKVVLCASQLSGHPEVYVRALSQVFQESTHEVSVLTFNSDAGTDWIDPGERLQKMGITVTSLGDEGGHIGVSRRHSKLLNFLKSERAGLVFFVDADSYRDALTAIASGELAPFPCRSAGIFSHTVEWCPGEAFYFSPPSTLTHQARSALGRVKRWAMGYRSEQQVFFEDVIEKSRVLNYAIVKDERIMRQKGKPFIWMPDIYDSGDELARELTEGENIADQFLNEYMEDDPRELLLFYGSGAWYKGYDYFLKLASLDPNVIALHVGAPERKEAGKRWDFDTTSLRRSLLREERLVETAGFASPAMTHRAFSKTRRFVSFHRLTGSSGTVLQSLAYGKPVLTPATGLIGHRTKHHGIGQTYRALDIDDLYRKWIAFKKVPTKKFKSAIENYISTFSHQSLRTSLTHLLQVDEGAKHLHE